MGMLRCWCCCRTAGAPAKRLLLVVALVGHCHYCYCWSHLQELAQLHT